MASELKVDKFTGVTTAGSILVTGEGNSTTTNLQQGLAKAWTHLNGSGTIAVQDSFNTSSVTDRATGRYEFNRTNNMVNRVYVCSGSSSASNGDASSVYVSDNFFDFQVQGPYSTSASTSGVYDTDFIDAGYVANIVNGDLA
jgi:hypothetical protein